MESSSSLSQTMQCKCVGGQETPGALYTKVNPARNMVMRSVQRFQAKHRAKALGDQHSEGCREWLQSLLSSTARETVL